MLRPFGADTRRLVALLVLVITVGMFIGSFATTWDEVHNGGPVRRIPVGTDFATFQGAAALVLEGRSQAVYNPADLGEKLTVLASYENEPQAYGHPPFFPFFFVVPFAFLPFAPAYLLYTATGIGLLALGAHRAGSSAPQYVVGLALISIPGYATVKLGQTGFFAAAILFAVYLALRRGKDFRAGLILGLLAFKPYYAAGIAIWWLLRPRRYLRALGGAASSVIALIALGSLISDGWSTYWAYATQSMGEVLSGIAGSGFSLYEMWSMLLPDPYSTVLWLASAIMVVAVFRHFLVRVDHHLESSVAAAVIAGLLVSTRIGWYDWVLIAVPATLFWVTLPAQRSRLVTTGIWLFPVAGLSWSLARTLQSTIGVYWQSAPVILALVAWWFLRGLEPSGSKTQSPSLRPSTAAS